MDAADDVEQARQRAPSPTVLVVEDDPLTRLVVAEFFREAGLTVAEATSGDEAWKYIESGGKADLVFTDIQMPGQIDGRELANLISRNLPQLKVIVTSGNAGPSAGVDPLTFLRKPYDVEQATRLVLKLLGSESGGNSDNPACTGGNSR